MSKDGALLTPAAKRRAKRQRALQRVKTRARAVARLVALPEGAPLTPDEVRRFFTDIYGVEPSEYAYPEDVLVACFGAVEVRDAVLDSPVSRAGGERRLPVIVQPRSRCECEFATAEDLLP